MRFACSLHNLFNLSSCINNNSKSFANDTSDRFRSYKVTYKDTTHAFKPSASFKGNGFIVRERLWDKIFALCPVLKQGTNIGFL